MQLGQVPLPDTFQTHNRTICEVNGELINEDNYTSQFVDHDVRILLLQTSNFRLFGRKNTWLAITEILFMHVTNEYPIIN